MTARRTRKRPTKAEPVIRPTGDVGLFRVNFPDGTASEAVTLGEAREIARMSELKGRRRLYN